MEFPRLAVESFRIVSREHSSGLTFALRFGNSLGGP